MRTKLIIQKLEMIDKLLFKDLDKYERKGIRDTLLEIKESLGGLREKADDSRNKI